MAWSQQRGVNPMVPGVGVGDGARHRRPQGAARPAAARGFGRNLTTLGPFLTGAAVASYLNRRATKSLGDQVIRDDLRKQQRQGHRAVSRRRCAPSDRRGQPHRVARADHPVRRRVRRVVEHHLHGAGIHGRCTTKASGSAADAEQLALAGGVQRDRVGDERERGSRASSTTQLAAGRPRPGSGRARHRPTSGERDQHHERQPGAYAAGAHPDLDGEQRRDAPRPHSHSHQGSRNRSA